MSYVEWLNLMFILLFVVPIYTAPQEQDILYADTVRERLHTLMNDREETYSNINRV